MIDQRNVPDIVAAVLSAFEPRDPELRQDRETEKGPHRSATPMDDTMSNTAPTPIAQPAMSFIREGLVSFSPDQAASVLKWCRYERQRDETRAKTHIAALAEQMQRGLWLPKTQIDFARVGSRLILVNGHHRMHAQAQAAVNILWNVVIHDCADEMEVASLYWKFDTTLRKRSASNILDGIGFAQNLGLSKQCARALWGAAPIISLGMKMYRYQTDAPMLPDQRQELASSYGEEARMSQGFLAEAPPAVRKRMLIPSRFAMMLVILRHQREKGTSFWDGFCRDDGLAKGDPRKTLLQDLASRPNNPGLQAQHMMAIARAWNAFFEGRSSSIIKVTGNAVPIAGTGYVVRA